jgi:enoyl-CoA hydratase/carnithine racemase
MAMTGDAIDAHTAAQWGLINKVVPDDQLDDAVHDLLGRACRGSLWSKAVGKQAFYAQIDMSQTDAYIYASEVMARAVAGADAQEGIDAFLNKRAPVFTERPTTGE